MKTYNLPIQNLNLLQNLHQSTLCPDELNHTSSFQATWVKSSDLPQLPQETQDYFVALNSILLQPNVCIIATKSSDFTLSYTVREQFFTVKNYCLFNLAGEPLPSYNIEVYVTPLAIPDFIVQDVLNVR